MNGTKNRKGAQVAASSQDPLLGFAEIAELAGVKVQTTWEWKKRRILPEPDRVLKPNKSQWKRSRILAWLESTGRLPS